MDKWRQEQLSAQKSVIYRRITVFSSRILQKAWWHPFFPSTVQAVRQFMLEFCGMLRLFTQNYQLVSSI